MEQFKTQAGSWNYADGGMLHIGMVPLYSGFMYAAVGSYIARVWRIFALPLRAAIRRVGRRSSLAVAIYVNFFAHHWLPDIRLALFAATALLFWRTRVYFTPFRTERWMPLLLGWFLVARSSGSPRISAPSRTPGPIPTSATAGIWSARPNSARGIC